MNMLKDRKLWTGLDWREEDPDRETGLASRRGAAAADADILQLALMQPGFEARFTYEQAADWRDREVLSLEVWIPKGHTLELTLRVYPLRFGRPEYVESTAAFAAVSGEGWTTVELARDAFDCIGAAPALWRLVHQLGLAARLTNAENEPVGKEIALRRLELKRKSRVALRAARLSQTALPQQTAEYRIEVSNETDSRQAVTLKLDAYGFESLPATVKPSMLLLKARETKQVVVRASMHDGVAPGGCEKLTLSALPDGDSAHAQRLLLYAVRPLPHPYMIHTEAGWDGVQRNVACYDWAREELAEYIRRAEAWAVPEPRGAGAAYAFELAERFNLHAAGVAWRLTGRRDLLDKVQLFMRRFADPQHGYPATDAPALHIYASDGELALPTPRAVKVCGGGLIHEGEFMLDVASVYDLTYEADGWHMEDHRRIEAAFRLFIAKTDWMITDGDTNNIPSGGMIGALLCSLAIQDMHWVRRFIDGPGGFIDMVSTGVMDDGWYFEGASNYVLLFADMFTRLIQACEPWGFNLKERYVPPSYNPNAMLSPWSLPREQPFLGMSFAKYGPVQRNYRTVKDVWDAMLPFVDERGILVGNNDTTDKDAVRGYDLAYYVWRDPRYAAVIRGRNRRDLVYGVGELPEASGAASEETAAKSAYADNVGLAILRSAGGDSSSRLQAVVKYGSHGGYHGHFDRTGLTALKRYGKNAYGPLASWFGYDSFMFKMWVQASMSHNMVVVDGKMQEPAESQRLLFHSGELLQACVVETHARWSDPPYGGQTPYPQSFPQEKGWIEGRQLPEPPESRAQGSLGRFGEPIRQRRLVGVTSDYVLLADYVCGEETHIYDCLHHYQGFLGLEGQSVRHLHHTGKMFEDPYGSGQFITDCDWHGCEAPVVARFSHQYDRLNDDSEGRHMQHSEEGRMDLNLHSLWPPQQELMTGWYAEGAPVHKQLHYEVLGDGELLERGRSGIWILGARRLHIPLAGQSVLTLRVQVERSQRKTVFWGNPVIVLADGRRIALTELPMRKHNIDEGNGIGLDYYGGPVHLEGEQYADALPFEPLDDQLPAVAEVDLRGLEAAAFEAVIGGDYPLGLDSARRKTISVRVTGREACFLTLLEPHEQPPAVIRAEAAAADRIRVQLADGRRHEIELNGLQGDGSQLRIRILESAGGRLLREEQARADRDPRAR